MPLILASQPPAPTLHAPNSTNNTNNFWDPASAPINYNFPTNSSVIIDHDTNCSDEPNFDACANVFPSLVLHGSGTPFHSALLLGNNGHVQLRRSLNSSIGMVFSTYWANDSENYSLNSQGGYISFQPRSTQASQDGSYQPGTDAMRIIPGGNVGIGTANPSEQLHTTKGVRFEGLTFTNAYSDFLVRDQDGKLYYTNLELDEYITSSCNSPNFFPLLGGTNNKELFCSIMSQRLVSGCTGEQHESIGVNGPPIGFAFSGETCHDIYFTVHGSAFAAGGLWIASDSRIKKNIEPIQPSDALKKVISLRPVNYDFALNDNSFDIKGLPKGRSTGLIAQEVAEVIPEAVGVSENELMVLNYDVLTPYLIGAIKSQQEIIESQQQKIYELEIRLELIEELLANNKKSNSLKTTLREGNTKLEVFPNPSKPRSNANF